MATLGTNSLLAEQKEVGLVRSMHRAHSCGAPGQAWVDRQNPECQGSPQPWGQGCPPWKGTAGLEQDLTGYSDTSHHGPSIVPPLHPHLASLLKHN